MFQLWSGSILKTDHSYLPKKYGFLFMRIFCLKRIKEILVSAYVGENKFLNVPRRYREARKRKITNWTTEIIFAIKREGNARFSMGQTTKFLFPSTAAILRSTSIHPYLFNQRRTTGVESIERRGAGWIFQRTSIFHRDIHRKPAQLLRNVLVASAWRS